MLTTQTPAPTPTVGTEILTDVVSSEPVLAFALVAILGSILFFGVIAGIFLLSSRDYSFPRVTPPTTQYSSPPNLP